MQANLSLGWEGNEQRKGETEASNNGRKGTEPRCLSVAVFDIALSIYHVK
jgi:hypothetical protein